LLVYVGTHQYADADGVKHNVQSFAVYQPITRDQFAQALASGLKLVRYKIVMKKTGERSGPGKPMMGPGQEPEIISQPVGMPAGAPPVAPKPPA
jgi:hypothetical protein